MFSEKIRAIEFDLQNKNTKIKRLLNELEQAKKEKGDLYSKLTGFQSASKDLDNLLGSQRTDKNKEGLGYSAVPTLLLKPSSTIESNTDDTNKNSSVTKTRESSSIITSKPTIKFMKAAERPTETKTDKVETAKKSAVKYAKMYRRTSKSSNRVKRLESKLKARTSPTKIHKVDRGRSRSVMAWVPKKVVDPIFRNNKWYQSLVRSFDQEKNNIQAQLNLHSWPYQAQGLTQVEAGHVEYKSQEIKFCKKIKAIEFDLQNKNIKIKRLLNELEQAKKEKGDLDSKLTGFQSASKDLDNLLGSQRTDKNKEGLGYSVVPPSCSNYSRPSPTIESNTDDTNRNSSITKTRESSSIITSKPTIKFVKAAERPTETKIDKVETAKKSAFKYTEMYRRTSKSSNVRGNQRNWNNLKSQ
uniref:Uncharacterized protein n=1 Tax=Tanacetum cinerariifolium TaxID=118510 RepID=A0A6L2LAA7_TANCI|nr:hypothetical protein [Tanacetum cinerariifolium]